MKPTPKVDLKKAFLQAFHALPPPLQKVPLFLAVSGGMDSSVLLSVALELRDQLPPLLLVHVNYHLRIPDSDQEEDQLRRWAIKTQLPFHRKSLRPPKQSVNIQAWAREQRFKFFQNLIEKKSQGQGLVCLAHHQRDQAETILARLLRGSSLSSLGGMESLEFWKTLVLFRPFLTVPHEALQHYARTHQVSFLEDKSNRSTKYLRNRLRHQLLPLLKKENPQILSLLGEWGSRWRDVGDWIEIEARQWLKRQVKKSGNAATLKVSALKKLHPALSREVLAQWLLTTTGQDQGINPWLIQIRHFLSAPKKNYFISLKNSYRLHLSPDRLRLSKSAKS